MKKKQLALLLILLTAVIIFLGYPVLADEDDIAETGDEVAVDGLVYEVQENNTVTLIDYQKAVPANLTISGSITYNQQVYTVTSIQEHTFSGCDTLTNVIIEENITDIGEYTFSECESLHQITFPSSLKTLGRGIFSGSDNVGLIICAGNDVLQYEEGLLTQDDRLLYVSPALERVSLPQTIHTIAAYAFQDCNYLENITIPRTIEKIEEQAFCKCYGIHSITMENNPNIIIENNAFADMVETGIIYVPTQEMKQHIELNSQCYPKEVQVTQMISYEISYNTGGGVFKEACITKADNTQTVLLPDVEKQGFEFLGWCRDEACEQESVYQIEEGQSDNVVLYAKWEAIAEPEQKREEQIQEVEPETVARKGYEIASHEKSKHNAKVQAEDKSTINMVAEVELASEVQPIYQDTEEENEIGQQQLVKEDGEMLGQKEAEQTTEAAETLVQSEQNEAQGRNTAYQIVMKLLFILGILLLLAGGIPNKRQISSFLLILIMSLFLFVPVAISFRAAAAPVLTQKIVLRDAQKAQRENVTVNKDETLSSCYVEITPANVTNQSVTFTSSNPSIMTVAQHKGTDGRTYADITGINSGVATLTVTAQDTGKTYSLSISVAIPLESTEAELKRALNPKKTAQDTAASFTTTCSAGQRGTVVGEVGDYYFFDIPKGVLEKNYHAAYVKKSDLLIYANAVTLTPGTITLNKGQKQKLTATVTPGYATEKTVQYSTSNGTIASISKAGNIKAKKKGTVTITATIASKSNGQVINRTATVGVTVKQPVKKLTIKPSRLTLEKGKTKKLNVIKSPANADDALITYQSSNETVAAVNQTGSVTAKKEGTAVITVENKPSGKKKTCKITVTDTHSYELIIDEELTVGKTYQAQVVKKTALKKQAVSRGSTPKNLYYKSSNPKVIKVDRKTGKVTPLKQGSVTISFINQETRESVGKRVSSIQLTKKELTKLATEERFLILKEKQTAYLFGKDYSNKEMSISSDAEKTATVTKNGKVTAITAGSCTITTKLRYKTVTTTVFVYRPALQYGISQKTLTLYQKKGISSVQSLLDNDRSLNIKGRIGKEFYYVEILNKQGKITGTGLTGQKDILIYSRRANRDYISKMKKGDWKYLHYSNTVARDKTDHAPIQMVLVDDTVHIYVNFQYKGKADNKFITYDKKGNIVQHKKTYRQVFENGIKKYWGNKGKTIFTGGSKYFTMDLGVLLKKQYYHEKDFAEGVRLKCNVHINEKLGKLDERIPVYIGNQNKSSEDNTYWFWVTDKNISYKPIKGYDYRLYKPNSENWYINIPTNEQLWSNKVNAMKMGKKTARGTRSTIKYEKTCAHEFGHVLGLNDAYDLEDEHLGTKTISRKEPSMVEKYYNMALIMDKQYHKNFTGIRENDLEMILFSYNYSKHAANEYSWQSYRNYQTEWNKCGYVRSNAITWKLEK